MKQIPQQRINPRYFPRTLGVYQDTCRSALYRMIYPYRVLAEQGYPVGWCRSARSSNLDSYDVVVCLRTPHTDDVQLAEQIAYARHAKKIVLLDNAAAGILDAPFHGTILPDDSYATGGKPFAIADTGVDPQTWATHERWTDQCTIGLISDVPDAATAWMPLLPALRRIREDFPTVRLAMGYETPEALIEVATDVWSLPLLMNEHPHVVSSVDILLCYSDLIQSHDIYEAGQWGGAIIADPKYSSIVRSKGIIAAPDAVYDAVAFLMHNPSKRKAYAQALQSYVASRKTLAQTVPHIARAWQDLYGQVIGTMRTAHTC